MVGCGVVDMGGIGDRFDLAFHEMVGRAGYELRLIEHSDSKSQSRYVRCNE